MVGLMKGTDMRITSLFYLAVVFILTTLLFQPASFAQEQAQPVPLKISVAIESDQLSRPKPALVTITIENLSSQALDIKSIASFRLSSTRKEAMARRHEVFGDSYWSPVNLSAGTPKQLDIMDPELEKKGVIVGRVPEETLHFESREVKKFSIDPTKTLWNAEMGNDWPRWNLYEAVPKGVYLLEFKLSGPTSIRSNTITVTIK